MSLIRNFETFSKDIEGLKASSHIVLVDEKVYQHHKNRIDVLKEKLNCERFFLLPEGEKVKTFSYLEEYLEKIIATNINRSSHLIAIGGGACSDFSGLVASMLLRGISWSVIPTTTLAMVDAAIGGKVAVNSKTGKNLIGAFHFPDYIWIDETLVETLDQDHQLSGLGEIYKYAFLSNTVYQAIMNDISLTEIMRLCAQVKEEIVLEDPTEKGIRKTLNLGHSFGHAYEKIMGIPHGLAVVWGLDFIFDNFQENNFFEQRASLKIKLGLNQLNFDDVDHSQLMSYLVKDKKMADNQSIDLIICEEIGNAIIKNFKLEDIKAKLIENKN